MVARQISNRCVQRVLPFVWGAVSWGEGIFYVCFICACFTAYFASVRGWRCWLYSLNVVAAVDLISIFDDYG